MGWYDEWQRSEIINQLDEINSRYREPKPVEETMLTIIGWPLGVLIAHFVFNWGWFDSILWPLAIVLKIITWILQLKNVSLCLKAIQTDEVGIKKVRENLKRVTPIKRPKKRNNLTKLLLCLMECRRMKLNIYRGPI